jgi:hypothetical protein
MHSEDRGPGIRTPQEQLLLSMLYFVGTDVSLDTGWDQDPCRGPAIDVFFKLSGGRCQTHRQRPPRGPAINTFFSLGGGRCRIRLQCPPSGPIVDVFYKLDGGGCQTRRQRPLGGL